MNGSLMFTDHATKKDKRLMDPKPHIPQPQPERRSEDTLFHVLVVASLAAIVLALASFALKLVEERAVTAQVLRLTEDAIKGQQPACRVEIIGGIKVEHCVRMVGF